MLKNNKADDNNNNNLISNITLHLSFLVEIHSLGIRRLTNESLRRYSDLWLPLLVSQQHQQHHQHHQKKKNVINLVPPPDIAWLWHCHRLVPHHYVKYMKEEIVGKDENDHEMMMMFDSIIQHTWSFLFQHSEYYLLPKREEYDVKEIRCAADETQTLWEEKYPNEPFFFFSDDDTKSSTNSSPQTKKEEENGSSIGEYDLLKAAEDRFKFLWHVSDPLYKNEDFLRQGVRDYHRFLLLQQKKQCNLVPPTNQISLIWQTHILTCVDYESIIMPFHDNIPKKSVEETLQLWKEMFGSEYPQQQQQQQQEEEPTFDYYMTHWSLRCGHYHGGLHRVHRQHSPNNNNDNDIVSIQEKNCDETLEETLHWLEMTSPPMNHHNNDDDDVVHHHHPVFIRASSQDNPKKEGYIYGRGSYGLGYYRFYDSDESFVILIDRIDKSILSRLHQLSRIDDDDDSSSSSNKNKPSYPMILKEIEQLKQSRNMVIQRREMASSSPKETDQNRTVFDGVAGTIPFLWMHDRAWNEGGLCGWFNCGGDNNRDDVGCCGLGDRNWGEGDGVCGDRGFCGGDGGGGFCGDNNRACGDYGDGWGCGDFHNGGGGCCDGGGGGCDGGGCDGGGCDFA